MGRLRITRVDYKESQGASWDVLYRWAPDAVRRKLNCTGIGVDSLLSKYLDTVGAADQQRLDAFLEVRSRSRVQEAVRALMGVRELSFAPGDKGPLIHDGCARARGARWPVQAQALGILQLRNTHASAIRITSHVTGVTGS